MNYRVVSVDDHLVEPGDVFTKRTPASIRDRVPHIRDVKGTPKWFVEDRMIAGVSSNAGVAWQDFGKPGVSDSYDNMQKGGYDPVARLKEFDQDGVDASVCFPNFGRFHGDPLDSVPDLNVRLECIKAYNDWVVEDFCGVNPQRLIAQCLIPPWDIKLAVAEATRSIKKGHKALILGMAPDLFGYPTMWDSRWDPLWATAEEAGVPLAFHQISASMDRAIFQRTPAVNEIPGSIHSTLRGIEIPESIRAANIVNHISTLMVPLAELLFSGILDRFSKLRVVLAEGGASWVPWILGMCDYQGERSMYRGNSSTWPLKMRPSDYWKRQCAAGFWSDQISPYTLDFMGEDTVMWEGDYPHGIVTWPNSREIQNFSLLKVTDEKQRAKILAGNAVRMFNLA